MQWPMEFATYPGGCVLESANGWRVSGYLVDVSILLCGGGVGELFGQEGRRLINRDALS